VNYRDHQLGRKHELALRRVPTLLEMLGFATLMGNNLTGPAPEMRTYLDFCNREGLWAPGRRESDTGRVLPSGKWERALYKTGVALLSAATLLAFKKKFSPKFVVTEAFAEWPLWRRQGYMSLAMYLATCPKYFFVWTIAEVGWIASGFAKQGGHAPSSREPEAAPGREGEGSGGGEVVAWSGMENVQPLHVVALCGSPNEVATKWVSAGGTAPAGGGRGGPALPAAPPDGRAPLPLDPQNMKTAEWLRRYVYQRVFLGKGGAPTSLSMAATQVVSLVWHGLDVGYLTLFLSSILFFQAGKVSATRGAPRDRGPRPAPGPRLAPDPGGGGGGEGPPGLRRGRSGGRRCARARRGSTGRRRGRRACGGGSCAPRTGRWRRPSTRTSGRPSPS